jgi:hypothetical protein
MATARNIYPEPQATTYTVTFTYINGQLTVSNPAIIMTATDQIAFNNSEDSTATISFVFSANPPVPSPYTPPGPAILDYPTALFAPGAGTGNLAPIVPDGAVNYIVQVNGTQVGGPYAIQVGVGPLFVAINGASYYPTTAVVPTGGYIEFYTLDGNTYQVGWGVGILNPFPGLVKAYPLTNGASPYQNSPPNNPNTYTYNLSPNLVLGGGGGTVKTTQSS